ncbi:PREDICTED: uncharacterized protein LOC109235327 [Nicotiana attenuata]|uniref:UspA domain-containing protein n=1 Tax=Nicotiana attenuata TaxID=49451 RepID=A0A1J6HSJ8_NICAT|nr:PREDICTED: uncharacterized protein LOC109235327 [Nicotiana attenuata]OIS95893.1 hypothetical protein A4A49_18073 [Nicotiana attenuata]
MGRTGARMPSFCLNRIRPHVQIRSPPIQAKNNENLAKKVECDDHEEKKDTSSAMAEEKNTGDIAKSTPIIGRKIMIVIDSNLESKNALQWALTHTVQSHDLLVLLYFTKSSSKQDEDSKKEINPRIFEFLASMKNTCKLKRPEVQVEAAVAQGKEKGPVIVEEAKKQEVSLLVLAQKKKSMTWRLIMMWAGGRLTVGGGSSGGGGVVEYCIQNASCMAIAVRRKSKKLGGYLITTKRQKDFWLLA